MKESSLQHQILTCLKKDPLVAWVYTTSAGVAKGVHGGRPFRIGFNGLSDIIGQLKDGRLLAIEVKKPGGKLKEEQAEFIEKVNKNNGVGFMATSVDEVTQIITDLKLKIKDLNV